ncbi:MAG: outer membrane beta-barrel protein [Prevotella sp.]|nr:outer membrane beta-barrel protein [Prevotella sp.]
MKKIFFAIAALMMAAPSFAQFNSGGFNLDEENIYWGARIGINFAGIGGDLEADEGRTGMTLAGVVGLRVSDSTPLFLESGLYYSERGGEKLKGFKDPLLDKTHDGHLNYLEVPVLIKYGFSTDGDIAFLPFFGPYLSMGISGNYKYLKHPEMGFKLGCGMEWNNLYVEAAYQFGVTNIADYADYSSHGHNLGINFGINF